jgi:hypothetical protein
MKYVNILLAILFLASAILQYNDPPDDRLFWILIYGLLALISGLAVFGRYNVWSIALGMGIVLFYMFRLFPAFMLWINQGMPSIVGSMKAETPHIEFVREFLGLGICLLALIWHFIGCRRVQGKDKPFSEV